MNTIGIIAEYNPFHNGHLYQIESIRAKANASHIVIVMSGDYVQRGTPAWTDKYLRTQMALSCGADLVFELPVAFATASAETFAHAGINILSSLGFVDGICFGSECDNLSLLQDIADFLAMPPEAFDETLRLLTSQGLSYPAARQQALCQFFPNIAKEGISLLARPNNILAIEYLKAIQKQKSTLTPYLIPRTGSSYHDNKLDKSFSSATAIRKASFSKEETSNPKAFLHTITSSVPRAVRKLLECYSNRYPITANHFSNLLYYRLAHLTEDDLAILDMTDEIFHRIQKVLPSFVSYTDFISQLKTKQYTYSRISRVLLHSLLELTDNHSLTPALPYVPYVRLLGFRKEKSFLLRNECRIPVITKPADGFSLIDHFYSSSLSSDADAIIQFASSLYEKDISASNLYRQVQQSTLNCNRANEYHCHPVIF